MKINRTREQHQTEGLAANQECLKTMQEENDLEKQLDQARRRNLAEIEKTRTLRADFDKLKANYSG